MVLLIVCIRGELIALQSNSFEKETKEKNKRKSTEIRTGVIYFLCQRMLEGESAKYPIGTSRKKRSVF